LVAVGLVGLVELAELVEQGQVEQVVVLVGLSQLLWALLEGWVGLGPWAFLSLLPHF